jgi:hypothetical protein
VEWTGKLKVTRPEVEDLLDSAASIEHGGDEGIVASTLRVAPIHCGQNGQDLLVLKVLHGA